MTKMLSRKSVTTESLVKVAAKYGIKLGGCGKSDYVAQLVYQVRFGNVKGLRKSLEKLI